MHDDDRNTGKYIPSHHPRIMSQSQLTVSREVKHVMGTQHLSFRSDFLFCQFYALVFCLHIRLCIMGAWCLHKSAEGKGTGVGSCHMGAGNQTWSSTGTALWITSYEEFFTYVPRWILFIVCIAPCGWELTCTLTFFLLFLREGLTV